MFRNILTKILFCNELDLNNVLLHIPLGGASTLIPFIFYHCGFTGFGVGLLCILPFIFIAYEVIEKKVIQDRCYPDIQGYFEGFIGVAGIIAIVLLLDRII